MPGDLRGINTAGAIKLLQTYGMAAVELTGTSGELLQIASGKKATLSFPLPVSLAATAPTSIPLWYFDETNGLWKEDGAAVKTGNSYEGDVSHFSYWNCDIPFSNGVHFDLTVVDAAGNPVQNANVSFYFSTGSYTGCHGLTDSAGHIAGTIPSNAQLVLNIFAYPSCANVPIYSQPVTTATSSISLGTVTITNTTTSSIASGSGIVYNCSGQPVTNGYVIMYQGLTPTRYDVNSSGVFYFSTTFCGTANNAVVEALDLTTLQQSTSVTVALTTGTGNTIPPLTACGISAQAFFNYTINTAPTSIVFPVGQLYQLPDSAQINAMKFAGYQSVANAYNSISISMNNQNVAVGSVQDLLQFESTQTGGTTIPTPIGVNITEYGNVGQYIAGNFSGTVIGAAAPNTSYAITCSFRVKRQY
jgi:hypothetical protein